LGKYYLYFAHHQGEFIRLAYANRLGGDWTVYAPGVLHLRETACSGHIASPDVHVDEKNRSIRLYFHGIHAGEQVTFLAVSRDGLHFAARSEVLGPFYFRVFTHDGWHYAIAKRHNVGGLLLRSRDGLSRFEPGQQLLPRMRHAAVRKRGDRLQIFFSRAGDAAERILFSHMSLTPDWKTWQTTDAVTVLEPQLDYEGATLPLEPSRPGAVHRPVRQLRDPAFYGEDGKAFLLYAVAGERGIAIAEIIEDH
jgi:hypothetical protein